MGKPVEQMVLITTLHSTPVTFNNVQYDQGETIKYSFKATSKLGDLAQQISQVAWPPRLVCRGSELDLSKSLEQQGCQTKDTIYLLDLLPEGACKAWARTGRCALGSRCEHHKFHTSALSPRYIEHQAAKLCQSCQSPSTPPFSPTPSSSPTPSATPNVAVVSRIRSSMDPYAPGNGCHYAHAHTQDGRPEMLWVETDSEHSFEGSDDESWDQRQRSDDYWQEWDTSDEQWHTSDEQWHGGWQHDHGQWQGQWQENSQQFSQGFVHHQQQVFSSAEQQQIVQQLQQQALFQQQQQQQRQQVYYQQQQHVH